MLIIRGVNVFPSQVEEALLSINGVKPHYMIIVDRQGVLDTFEIKIEVDEKYFADEIGQLEGLRNIISHKIKTAVGLAAKITLVEPRSLERSMGKSKHVIDNRKLV